MKRQLLFLLSGAVCFVIVVMWVKKTIDNRPVEQVTQTVDTAPVVVANETLAVGTKLEAAHVRTVQWPTDVLPPGATGSAESVIGKIATTSILQNEPIQEAKLAGGDTAGVMPLVIPPGMRAISVPVSEVTGISGFVTPGTRVDIISIVASRSDAGGRHAFILLEDVKALATAQTLDEREATPRVVNTVTLLVTPRDAERLALATTEGTLQLVLRNFADDSPANATGVSSIELTGGNALASSTSIDVELIRGPDRIVEHF